MPVLPEVGSISTVSGPILPSRSSAWTRFTPIRSLTLEIGLKNSNFRATSATSASSAAMRGMRTNGVLPMVSAMLS